MRDRMAAMRWWKNRPPFDPELREAYATFYFICTLLFVACWLSNPSDLRGGLIVLAGLAIAMFHFRRGRVQFSLHTLLVFMTDTAVVVGLASALRHRNK